MRRQAKGPADIHVDQYGVQSLFGSSVELRDKVGYRQEALRLHKR